jgi:hypothetical protein
MEHINTNINRFQITSNLYVQGQLNLFFFGWGKKDGRHKRKKESKIK